MPSSSANISAIGQGIINTEVMKSLLFLGALYSDCSTCGIEAESFRLVDHLDSCIRNLEPRHKSVSPLTYIDLYNLCKKFNDIIIANYISFCAQPCSLLAIHIHYFEFFLAGIVRHEDIKSSLGDTSTSIEPLCIAWSRSAIDSQLQTRQRLVLPYSLPYIDSQTIRGNSFQYLEENLFCFTTLLGVSHAHISYLTPCLAYNLHKRPIHIYVLPEITSAYDHLLELEQSQRIQIHNLSTTQLTVQQLVTLAKSSDRFSISLAQAVEDNNLVLKPSSHYSQQPKESETMSGNLTPVLDRIANIGIHTRDNNYKQQPQLLYRNSSITTLIKASRAAFPTSRLIRLGRMGEQLNDSESSELYFDSNLSNCICHEPSLLKKLDLYIGTSSGCGPFIAQIYKRKTILINVLSPCFIYTYSPLVVLSFKEINLSNISKGMGGNISNEFELVAALCGEWIQMPIIFSEANQEEIVEILLTEDGNPCTKTLACVSSYFTAILGARAQTRIDLNSYIMFRDLISTVLHSIEVSRY